MDDDRTGFYKFCAHCGDELGIEDWPPIVEMETDDGERTLHSFCDGNCRDAWLDDA